MSTPPRFWLVLAFGEDRQYAGNTGYADDVQKHYESDSNVPNSRHLARNDIVVVRGTDRMLGIARIENVRQVSGPKRMLRCPVCSTTALKRRKELRPEYRCNQGHEFDEPQISEPVLAKRIAEY